MLRTLLVAIFFSLSLPAASQSKSNIFVDAGFAGSIGASGTYNYRLTEHLGIGAGVSVLQFDNSTRTAMFADLRKYWIKNQHAWFLFVDLGFDLFKDKGLFNYQPSDNAFYTGPGFGYCRTINKRGWGPYATLRYAGDNRVLTGMNRNGQEVKSYSLDGPLVISIGFKF